MKVELKHTCKKLWDSGYFYFIPSFRFTWEHSRKVKNVGRFQKRSIDILWFSLRLSFIWDAEMYRIPAVWIK